MSERKLQRHNVFITQIGDASGVFEKYLYCPFPADEIRVKQIAYFRDGGTTVESQGAFSLHVEGLGPGGPGGSILGSFIDPVVSFANITLPLPTPFMSGTYIFRVMENGAPTLAFNTGTLNFILEFRRTN